MNTDYCPQTIEQEIQQQWQQQQAFRAHEQLDKEKFYCLSMFPYPSGQLHMGHVRNYTLGDVISRYQRLLGKNVLQPMGWDAFGLPAENAAIQHKIAPGQWTQKNIDAMREQFKTLGLAYDWSRELKTCDPDYYRWEQWLFVRLFKKGLVYQKDAMVNWDPVDHTVLANEQVVDGRGWRSGALVERRQIKQWFIKITAYADELLDDLDKLDDWPNQVRTMQRNWIGRSHGVSIDFDVPDNPALTVFTTRPDTLYGATFIAIAAEHALAKQVAETDSKAAAFIEECRHVKVAEAELATMEKRGYPTGLSAIHPLTGEDVPIWIANFVLTDYGTGALMAVPGHDERDFEFAQKYQLPIQPVVRPPEEETWDHSQGAYTGKGKLYHSGEYDNLDFDQAFEAIANDLEKQGKGTREVHYRLRDWGVSRQRYWGTPIPMIHCPHCGTVPVPEDQLPVRLPDDLIPDQSGSPLPKLECFVNAPCPQCNSAAKRETDTFDTFVESSWYYARFASVDQQQSMLDDRANYWAPVDQYVGGVEHAVMHLLYARFLHKLLRDEGLLNSDEPFKRLLTQGMVLKDGAKMSKSKGNVVEPSPLIAQYGADTVRLFAMFAAPPEQSLDWSDSGVAGCFRFLKRLYQFAMQVPHAAQENKPDWANAPSALRTARRLMHEILQQAHYDYQRLQFNTVVSGCMKLLNQLEDLQKSQSDEPLCPTLLQEGVSILLRLLSPIAPHVTCFLWKKLDYGNDLLQARFPKVDEQALTCSDMALVIQVNGKLRAEIRVPADAEKSNIEQTALAHPKVAAALNGIAPKRVIYVPKKLVNIVV